MVSCAKGSFRLISFTFSGVADAEKKIAELGQTKSEFSAGVRSVILNHRAVNGRFSVASALPELTAVSFEGVFRENAEISVLIPADSVTAGCCTQGAVQFRLGSKGKAEDMREQNVIYTPLPSKYSFSFVIKFTGGVLSSFTLILAQHITETGEFAGQIRELMAQRAMPPQPIVFDRLPWMYSILEEIFLSRFSNSVSRGLYIAGDIFRVTGLILNATAEDEKRKMAFESYEELMLRNIPERMMLDAGDPPTIEELAREIGISATKLKTGFNRMYGMPPYAYFKKLKLQKAYELVLRKDVSIREIAFRCGYSSQSQFCEAFKKEFGVKPSTLMKTGE